MCPSGLPAFPGKASVLRANRWKPPSREAGHGKGKQELRLRLQGRGCYCPSRGPGSCPPFSDRRVLTPTPSLRPWRSGPTSSLTPRSPGPSPSVSGPTLQLPRELGMGQPIPLFLPDSISSCACHPAHVSTLTYYLHIPPYACLICRGGHATLQPMI